MSTTNPSKDDPNGDVTVGTSPPPAPPSTDTHIIIDVNGSLTGPTDPSAATASKDATSKSTPNGAPDAAEQQKEKPKEPVGKTWSLQHKLPKLPIPKLEDSCKRYLRALEGLQVGSSPIFLVAATVHPTFRPLAQDPEEHENTKRVVQEFLTSGEGHKWQAKLEEYDKKVDSYIEEFWCEFRT
jgi:carnitine O-acetyltransferase